MKQPAAQLPEALQITPGPQEVPAEDGGWVQVPLPLQTSWVHALPSLVQVVPEGMETLVGQASLEPVQYSVASHAPVAERQTVEEGCLASAGQSAELPEQYSAASQTSAAARHWTEGGRKVQVPTVPVRLHASHEPEQAVLQHTPSTQLPLRHPEVLVQLPPLGFWSVQAPFWQVLPLTH